MSDRGRDTSLELTEIRTVLGRAESALFTLRALRDKRSAHARVQDDQGFWHIAQVDYTSDPDLDEMIWIIEGLAGKLAKWRRTGKTTNNVNLPEGATW